MATSHHPAPLIIETSPHPGMTVIFVHGLGTSGRHHAPWVRQLGTRTGHSVRFVLPTAPQRPVRWCEEQLVTAWFDLLTPDFNDRVDVQGIQDAVDMLNGLIQNEIDDGQPAGKIVMIGFSQGGALSLLTALQSAHRLGGAAALSGWLPVAAIRRARDVADLPVFLGHGRRDPVTPLSMAHAAREWLHQAGAAIDLHTYNAGHTITAREISDLETWLYRQVSAGLSS